MKELFLIIYIFFATGCASSIQYKYDEKTEKWVPVSKFLNRGIGVKADHKNLKIENSVISIPKIELRD